MDLEHRMVKTILAGMITAAPEWMFKKYPQARFEALDEFKGVPAYSGSSATGGIPGLCLDNPEVRGPRRNLPHGCPAGRRSISRLAGLAHEGPGGSNLWVINPT